MVVVVGSVGGLLGGRGTATPVFAVSTCSSLSSASPHLYAFQLAASLIRRTFRGGSSRFKTPTTTTRPPPRGPRLAQESACCRCCLPDELQRLGDHLLLRLRMEVPLPQTVTVNSSLSLTHTQTRTERARSAWRWASQSSQPSSPTRAGTRIHVAGTARARRDSGET